jgi:hypothetical protein
MLIPITLTRLKDIRSFSRRLRRLSASGLCHQHAPSADVSRCRDEVLPELNPGV